ncbi:LacI family DNA-binding transcriptional regulator [Enterobacteriaceae bacterium RIT714]|uniref:LacI family DNA-binding transcriptional regulator n=1 Tax=Lelliottia sp. CFBP8978 TaxID=3096522 RepID=UPI0012AC84C6|nr:LacI family DNA-binding transcriptional regulator [Lelliottia sp. CFBP8978]MDY1037721.1 LacI family DNA-binding transcriptional regulator [Lelliottia sp. CFBP8978]MRS90500.1 LacI family DNA-binding transcriptional regulator [Enterobacteriaceae bacterium RIT714]
MPGKLKMDEIAALTGYSISTVSRVLSGKSYTSDKAREAIVKCARELGVMASLASGRLLINGIAVFAPERTFHGRGDIFYLEVTKGIAEASAPHDVWVTYCGLEEKRADVKLFLEKAGHKNINAIIIIGTDDATILKLATTLNKPCVLINSIDREMTLDSVSPDHRAIGFMAMRHLFDQGHRRVLIMTCLRRETLYARLDGIKEAYRHFHVSFDSQHDLLVMENFAAEEAERALDDWLSTHDKALWPEVIFPNSISMTEGVLKALHRHGVRVPEEMSIMTTDLSWNLQNRLDTPVTGITVPCRELGIEAVHLLQMRMNRPQASVFNLMLQGKVMDYGSVSSATRHAARVALDE